MEEFDDDQEITPEVLRRWMSALYLNLIKTIPKRRPQNSKLVDLLKHIRNKRISLVDQMGFLIDGKDVYIGATTALGETFFSSTTDEFNSNKNIIQSSPFFESSKSSTEKSSFNSPFAWSQKATKRAKIIKNLDADNNNVSPIITSKFFNDSKTRPNNKQQLSVNSPCRFKRNPLCKLSGQKHGIIVHSEIEIITDLYQMGVTDTDILLQKIPQPDPCTIFILASLVWLGWRPVIAEFRIFQESTRIATAIDLIVEDTKTIGNDVVVIEEKIGFEYEQYDGVEGADEKFSKSPFKDILDCPKNRHLIQLTLSLMILEFEYNFIPDRAVVLRRQPRFKCCSIIDLDIPWAQSIYNSLLSVFTKTL